MKAGIYKDAGCKRMAAAFEVYNEQGSGLRLETASRAALMFGACSFFGIWDLAL